uniref:Uncharacterized protein n=1 Tax=Peronospora matthiolae TaxID=2874970 RepID=A0AAV1TR76_9STRA
MAPALPAPPTLEADSLILSSTPPPSPPLRRPVVLPSFQVSAASSLNCADLIAGITAPFGQPDFHAAVVADNHSLEELCRDQKLQIDRLQMQLQSYFGGRLAHGNLCLTALSQSLKGSLRCNREVARVPDGAGAALKIRSSGPRLKSALSEAEKKFTQVEDLRTRESSAAQQQVEAMTSRLAAAEQNSDVDK